MEQDLISKKELLDLTGISYGQLYRWKRKNLIPEEWFIRKSTFTGQETFFPKDKVLSRIDRIKNMKDGLSLDELADVFSPSLAGVQFMMKDLIERNIVTKTVVDVSLARHPERQSVSFEQLLCMYAVDILLQAGEIGLEEGHLVLQTMEDHAAEYPDLNFMLLVVRKMGIAIYLVTPAGGEAFTDDKARIAAKLHIPACVEQLKSILS